MPSVYQHLISSSNAFGRWQHAIRERALSSQHSYVSLIRQPDVVENALSFTGVLLLACDSEAVTHAIGVVVVASWRCR